MWQKFLCRIGWHDWVPFKETYKIGDLDNIEALRLLNYFRHCKACNKPEIEKIRIQ